MISKLLFLNLFVSFILFYNVLSTIMNKVVILLLCVLVLANTAGFWQQYKNFQQYAKDYSKNYRSYAIQFYRFAVYLNNLAQIQRLNLEEQGTAVYGLTKFTDMTKAEMKTYLGLVIPQNFTLKYAANFTNDPHYKPRTDIPDIWNWQQQGAVSSVKDQGSCGSCWTFSTAGNVQGQWFLKKKQLVQFSMQQLIDCDKSNFGCSGGWPYMAIDWLSKHGGLQTFHDYPLRTNYSGPCQFNQSKALAKVKGYMNITRDQAIIKDALYEKGPLSILLDFTGMFHYKSGIADPRWCSTWPDHALVLVGYGTQNGDYWLIKNSWGPKWGINGYLMLKRGHKKCGISEWATTAILDD